MSSDPLSELYEGITGNRSRRNAAENAFNAQKDATIQANETLSGYQDLANDAIRSEYGNAASALAGARGDANRAIAQSYNRARSDMGGAHQNQVNAYHDYRQAGARALAGLQNPTLGMGDITKTPGYQFRLKEGQNALEGSAAARGMLNSGATLKALQKHGQEFASNEYDKAYNRQSQRLTNLAGLGFNSTQGVANAHGQYGSNIGNLGMAQGNAMAGNDMAYGQNRANLGMNMGNQLGANYMTTGANMSNNITGLGNAGAASSMAAMPMTGMQALQGIGNFVGDVGKGAEGLKSAGALLAFSDSRLKTNVSPISKSDLAEMKRHLKAVYFKYLNDDHGDGRWAGVMAQDLEKSRLGKTLISEDLMGRKRVDMKKVLSMFLATMAMEV